MKLDCHIPCSQKCEINALKQLILSSYSTHFEPLKMSGISRFNSDLFSHVHLVIIVFMKTFLHSFHQTR